MFESIRKFLVSQVTQVFLLIESVIALGLAFHWYEWEAVQVGAVQALIAAAFAVFVQRGTIPVGQLPEWTAAAVRDRESEIRQYLADMALTQVHATALDQIEAPTAIAPPEPSDSEPSRAARPIKVRTSSDA